ncbi:ankyrin repeat-containing domain protein, partial [Lasiosphaeris hirsuta]
MADPISVIAAIETLGAVLQSVALTIAKMKAAPKKVIDIREECIFTRHILLNIRREINIDGPPPPYSSRAGAKTQAYDGDPHYPDFSALLQNTIDQLSADTEILLGELRRLCPLNPESKLDQWVSNGAIVWRTRFLEDMLLRIQARKGNLQLVLQSKTFAVVGLVERRASSPLPASPPRTLSMMQEKFLQAVKLKNIAAVEALLNQRLDPNFQLDDNEPSPLKVAVRNDDFVMVQRLCSHGARADSKTQNGKTLLMLAIENNRINSALALIQYSAAVSAADSQGRTALHMAAKGNHLALVQELLKAKADPNTPSRGGLTPVMEAAFRQDSDPAIPPNIHLIGLLLHASADPNAQNPDGHTLLHKAAMTGDASLLALLLQKGADPSLPDKAGQHALHHAASLGHATLTTALLSHSLATIDAADAKGITPLMLAAGAGHDAVVHQLTTHGADVARRSAMGFHALYAACAGGHLLCAALLVGRGAEVDGADCRGNTPLHVAAKNGRVEMVRWLLSMGADKGRRSVGAFEGLGVVGTPAEVA